MVRPKKETLILLGSESPQQTSKIQQHQHSKKKETYTPDGNANTPAPTKFLIKLNDDLDIVDCPPKSRTYRTF